MGETAENLARAAPDHAAASRRRSPCDSQRKAAAAQAAGPAGGGDRARSRNGDATSTQRRLHPAGHHASRGWPSSSPRSTQHGTVTAGTSSPLTDGAAAVLVVLRARSPGRTGLAAAGAHQRHRGRRLRARDHGHRPGACDAQGAGARRPAARRHRRGRAQRGVRGAGAGLRRASSASTRAGSTSTAAPSRSAIRSAPPAPGSPARRRRCCSARARRYALATQCIGGGQGIATVLEAV